MLAWISVTASFLVHSRPVFERQLGGYVAGRQYPFIHHVLAADGKFPEVVHNDDTVAYPRRSHLTYIIGIDDDRTVDAEELPIFFESFRRFCHGPADAVCTSRAMNLQIIRRSGDP
jgi:hypothetical protein